MMDDCVQVSEHDVRSCPGFIPIHQAPPSHQYGDNCIGFLRNLRFFSLSQEDIATGRNEYLVQENEELKALVEELRIKILIKEYGDDT